MLLTSSWLLDLLIIFAGIFFFVYKYSVRRFDYWKIRRVPFVKPSPIFGNAFELFTFKKNIAEWLKGIYDSYDAPYVGIFMFDEPLIVLKSPELVKHILVKDFNNFNDRTIATPKHNELLSNMMFLQKNPEWKIVRAKVSPIFTSGKLKGMFPLIQNVGNELAGYLEKHLGDLEFKEVSAKFATDAIFKCAFGISAHSIDDENADFRKVGRAMFDLTLRNGFVQTAYFFRQSWVNLFRLNFFEKWIPTFFADVFWQAMNQRERGKGKVNDMIDILKDMMENKELCKDFAFEGDKVAAHALQFFAAGFETTSSTIAFTLYELTANPNIQHKLRNEIISNFKEHGGMTYEGILKMKYLDLCVAETLRMYPALAFLDRISNADYQVPGTDLVLEKGMKVYIPTYGLQMDEKYFPNPKTYKPERFLENVNSKNDGLVYLPFGDGPRSCIGERFGLLATKIAIISIISKFELERNSKTPVPMELEPKSFVLQSKVGIPLRLKRFIPMPA